MRTNKRTYISIPIFIITIIVIILWLNSATKSKGYNVILITFDALRSDHLGCYGYGRNTAPFLNEFTKNAVMFTQAIAHGSHTPPSFGAIVSGNYFVHHHLNTWGEKLNPALPTLAEILKKNGYQTFFISSAPHFKALHGFERGFDFFWLDLLPEKMVQSVIVQFMKLKNKKLFIWVHYMGTHHPYFGPKEYLDVFLKDRLYNPRRNLPIVEDALDAYGLRGIPKSLILDGIKDPDFYIAQYDAAIRFFDQQLNLLFSKLKELGLDKKTIIIISSDHGEMFGEHGYYFHHGYFLYEPLIRVPLIISADGFPKGKIIDRQVEASVDMMPTILDALKLKTNLKFDGRSLVPLILDKAGNHKEPAFMDVGHAVIGVRIPPWKLIRYNQDSGATYELYNIDEDPGESVDLVNTKPEILQRLKEKLDGYSNSALKKKGTRKFLDEKSREKLRSLGYIQ